MTAAILIAIAIVVAFAAGVVLANKVRADIRAVGAKIDQGDIAIHQRLKALEDRLFKGKK